LQPVLPDCYLLCQTKEKSGVSSSIRSIKMCSCVQCAMQEKSVWCRDILCLAHVEQEPEPLSYLPGHWRLSLLVVLNKDGSGQCSGPAAQPRTCGLGECTDIVLYFSSSNTVFWNNPQMVICIVLIIVIFFRFD
jgi:hypothetical protein